VDQNLGYRDFYEIFSSYRSPSSYDTSSPVSYLWLIYTTNYLILYNKYFLKRPPTTSTYSCWNQITSTNITNNFTRRKQSATKFNWANRFITC